MSPARPGTTGRKRGNISGACAHCRRRKIRCTGERPACAPCQSSDSVCSWGPEEQDSRKPASRRYVQGLKDKISSLESLLAAIGPTLNTSGPAASGLIRTTSKPPTPGSSEDEGDDTLSAALLHLQIGLDREEINCHDPSSAFAHLTSLNDSNPFAPSTRQDSDGNGFKRFLPPSPAVQLSLAEHDALLESFFTFFSAWTLRTSPDNFKRDMFRCISSKPQINLSRYSVYSPFLHNVILAWALCLAEEPAIRTSSSRAPFVHLAERHLQTELDHPSLATVQGLGILSSVYSSLGRHTLGWSYMGLAERLVLSMGLNVTCTPLVQVGKISQEEASMRNHTYWSIFCQEQMWSIFVGRPHVPQRYNTRLPVIDSLVDRNTWWSREYIEDPPRPGWTSTAFHHTCKLSIVIAHVMTTLYNFHPNRAALSSHTLTSLGLALDQWIQDLPPCLHVNVGSERNALPHIIVLQLAREIVSMMIYRPFYHHNTGDLSLDEKGVAIRRCDRSALRASALLRLYRSAYGLRFAVPFMMIATYISGTTHLMRATRSRHCSPESSPIQEAQQCADIMTEMSSTFAVAARQADLLLSAIERYINHDAGSAAAVRQPVSIDTSKSIPENDVDFGDCNPMTEACSTSPTLPSSSMELTTSQQSLNRTLELLLAGPTIDLPITMAVGREDESVMEETAQVRSLGGEPNLWLWDFQSSRPDELSLSTRGDGMATGVDERNNPFDWDSDVLGLP